MVSISWLRLSTAPSIFKCRKTIFKSFDTKNQKVLKEEDNNSDGFTLAKSTENVESSWKTKAPFSYNQLNCNACPFLKPKETSSMSGTETIHLRVWILYIIHYPWASVRPNRMDRKHPARKETYILSTILSGSKPCWFTYRNRAKNTLDQLSRQCIPEHLTLRWIMVLEIGNKWTKFLVK